MATVKIGARAVTLNEKFTIELPNNGISEEGQSEIQDYLASLMRYTFSKPLRFGESPLPEDWNWEWLYTDRDSDYRGTFPKRVSKYMAKVREIRLEERHLSEIGNMAARHCPRGKFIVDFTRSFNWEAGDFGDKGSCFWGSAPQARVVLRRHRALAVRFYRETGEGYARAWLVKTPFGWAVFNGYGLETLHIARIVADWAGYTYRKIVLTNNGEDGGLLYINHFRTDEHDGSAYALGTAESLRGVQHHDFRWYTRCCAECETLLSRHTQVQYRYTTLCPACAKAAERPCQHCNGVTNRYQGYELENGWCCPACRETLYDYCAHCSRYHLRAHFVSMGRHTLCQTCATSKTLCDKCGRLDDKSDAKQVDGRTLCYVCYRNQFYTCQHCGQEKRWGRERRHPRYSGEYCPDCYGQAFVPCAGGCGGDLRTGSGYVVNGREGEFCWTCYLNERNRSAIYNVADTTTVTVTIQADTTNIAQALNRMEAAAPRIGEVATLFAFSQDPDLFPQNHDAAVARDLYTGCWMHWDGDDWRWSDHPF